jgi:hypothetical protein
MSFRTDSFIAENAGPARGQYLTTFDSANLQVRADFFRNGKQLTAYVSFPTGLNAGQAFHQFYDQIHHYAESIGYSEPFRVVYTY